MCSRRPKLKPSLGCAALCYRRQAVDHNPYAAPISDAAPRARVTLDEDRLLTPEIIEAMSQTRPWVVFLGILGFIGAGLLLLAGLGLLLFGGFKQMGGAEMGFISILYILFAVIYVFPSLYLYRYGASIKAMQQGYGVHALAEALGHQKSFWRLVGILSLIVVVIYAIGLLFVIAGAVLS